MILKGNARGNAADLATHLMNAYDNERVELAEMRGTIADDLHGGFAEFEAIASGTHARKPLYSLSINPHEALTREQYFEAIDAIENRLGLTGQPRAVVFHVKEGREHAHVVWSRIEGARMKAVHMAHDRRKLCDMAVTLAEKFGHELPDGLKAWKDKNAFQKDKLEPTLAENAMADKTGITPEQRREEITAAYEAADSAAAFRNALEEKGYVLARGDRRGFVLIDRFGDVHSLSRYLKGVKSREIKARMAALDPASLPTVDQAREQVKAHLAAQNDRAREQENAKQETVPAKEDGADPIAQRRKRALSEKRSAMKSRQAERRLALTQEEQALLTWQQQERLALHAAQQAERTGFFFRMRSKVADLIEATPALRSVLGPVTAQAGLDPRERHRLEREALSRRHARERRVIDGRKSALGKIEQRELLSLARDLKREALQAMLEREQQRTRDRAEDRDHDDDLRTDPRLLQEDALGQEFNAEARLDSDDGHDEGEGRDGHKPRKSWKQRTRANANKRGRGKGYGYRRDD